MSLFTVAELLTSCYDRLYVNVQMCAMKLCWSSLFYVHTCGCSKQSRRIKKTPTVLILIWLFLLVAICTKKYNLKLCWAFQKERIFILFLVKHYMNWPSLLLALDRKWSTVCLSQKQTADFILSSQLKMALFGLQN